MPNVLFGTSHTMALLLSVALSACRQESLAGLRYGRFHETIGSFVQLLAKVENIF